MNNITAKSTAVKKIAILGASSGLGLEIAKIYDVESSLFLSSRKTKNIKLTGNHFYFDCDFTKNFSEMLVFLKSFNPEVIIYTAGGGPYGDFKLKDLKDHKWSLAVNFEAPQALVHFCLNELPGLKQLCVVGSSVAENKADPKAASYSAGKHALVGLHKSVVIEEPNFDFRLFSPSYMDTKMLPKSAPVRKGKVGQPEKIAKQMIEWLNNSSAFQEHKVI